MTTTVNALPPEVFQTFLNDNSEEKIQDTCKDKINRVRLERWFSHLEDSLSVIKSNITLSLRILKVISQECEPDEFSAVQKIYEVFRETLLFQFGENVNFDQIAKEFSHKFHRLDPQGFEKYLKITNEAGGNPLHVAFFSGDIDFITFVEHHFPALFDHLLESTDYDVLSPLFVALHSKKINVLKFVKEHRPKIFIRFLETKNGKWERTPLLEAAAIGDLEFFSFVHTNYSEFYLRYSKEISKGGLSCLHWAAYNKHNSICDYIQCTDPEIFNQLVKLKDATNLTPLHYAILSLNAVFINKIKLLLPAYFFAFFKDSDPDVFRKLLCGSTDKPKPLLTLMIQDDEIELLDIILQKEPDLCAEILLTKEFSGYSHPLKIAFENECIPILDLLHNRVPALFDKLKDFSFVISLVEDLDENASTILPYCRNLPITTALLQTLCSLDDENYRVTNDHIKANLALPHAPLYLEAILLSESMIDYLTVQEDILTKYLDGLPNLDFLSWESGMDILVQLPPREIKNTIENIEKEMLDAIVDTSIFVQGDLDIEGSYLNFWWILRTVFERYENNLDDEDFLATAREELSLINPQGFAALCINEETEAMVKTLLKALPEPHYRVVIPVLSIDEYRTFINRLPMDRQLHFIRIATAEQKQDYLNLLQLERLDETEIWFSELDILIDEVRSMIEFPKDFELVLKKKFNELKKIWIEGQSRLIFLAKQESILVQLIHSLTFYENTQALTSLINSKINPYLQKAKKIHLNIKSFRSIIWESLAKNPVLAEEQIPEEFFCPITGEIMENPVIDPYGHTYEKEQILIWIKEKRTSPITRQPLAPEDLKPNLELKDRIEKYQQSKKSS